MCTTSGWALSRDHIVNLWRFVIVIRHIVISVILVIESEVDTGHGDAIESGWCNTFHFGRVDQRRLRLNVQIGEDAESVIAVVNLLLIDKWMHVTAH